MNFKGYEYLRTSGLRLQRAGGNSDDLLTSDPYQRNTCSHSEVPADIGVDVRLVGLTLSKAYVGRRYNGAHHQTFLTRVWQCQTSPTHGLSP